jgi:spermidine synthase
VTAITREKCDLPNSGTILNSGNFMGQLRTANKRHRRATVRGLVRSAVTGADLDWLAGPSVVPANDRHPIILVEAANIPSGGQLHLLRRGPDFSIQFCSDELMGSQDHLSEEALATLACERVGPERGDVLIGGLGMGFTLRAALAAWGPAARITVAELVPEVVSWARGPLAHLFGTDLRDERVSIEIADVHDLIVGADAAFDAILLDVDNGPDGFIRLENDRLYCNWGLRAAYAALRPLGVLAVWSAYADPAFARRLEAVGFAVEEAKISETGDGEGELHTIWLASKPE